MQENKRPLIIGVTGNIGSGKSTFCMSLHIKGLPVYSADLLAKRKLDDPRVVYSLTQRFGDLILEKTDLAYPLEPRISRERLAQIVFADPDALEYLNTLIHPLVLREMDEIVSNTKGEYVIFEVPLLFEANLQAAFDFVILVHSSPELRRGRVMARSGEKDVNRNQFQMDDEAKMKAVDLVIVNDGGTMELKEKAEQFTETIAKLPHRDVHPFYH